MTARPPALDAVRPGLRRGPHRRRRLVQRHGHRPGRHRREQQPAALDPRHRGGKAAGLGRHPQLGQGHHRLRADQRRLRGPGQGHHGQGDGRPEGPAHHGAHQPRRRGPADARTMLAGDAQDPRRQTITVEGSGEDFTVGKAKVVCGNVHTANATVYIIDGVLLPDVLTAPAIGVAHDGCHDSRLLGCLRARGGQLPTDTAARSTVADLPHLLRPAAAATRPPSPRCTTPRPRRLFGLVLRIVRDPAHVRGGHPGGRSSTSGGTRPASTPTGAAPSRGC